MSRRARISVVFLALVFSLSIVTLILPIFSRGNLADPAVEIDPAEGKTRLDSRVTFELGGSFSEDEIRRSLKITPVVTLGEKDLDVDHVAIFPWHERFPWAKTVVTINPQRRDLFKPEINYVVTLKDEIVLFETITLPKVVGAHTSSVIYNDFQQISTTTQIVLRFNEEVVWQDELLTIEPKADFYTAVDTGSKGETQLWIIPSQRWENATAYTLIVGEGLVDVHGHQGTESFSLDFTTWAAPRILEFGPTGDHLPLEQRVRIKFERQVDRASVEGAFSWIMPLTTVLSKGVCK